MEREFSSIYVFNLRGNARTTGELNRREGEPLFGASGGRGGSKTPIAITLLVKKPTHTSSSKAIIYYHDIGDYLKRRDKLRIIEDVKTFANPALSLQILQPNKEGDWISVRSDVFSTFIALEPEKKFDDKATAYFVTYAIGVATNRDAWVYNFSKEAIEKNMLQMIDFYNQQQKAYQVALQNKPNLKVEDFVDTNPQKISWTRALRNDVSKQISHRFNRNETTIAVYRPFCKQHLYFDKPFIESPGLAAKLFPASDTKNLVICVSGVGASKDFSTLMTDCIPNLDMLEKAQCFPLYYYEENKSVKADLFGDGGGEQYVRRDGVSDFILGQARSLYGKEVSKEDVFYYVYGLLHSKEYRVQFSSDLKKMLPRLPLVSLGRDFWLFSKAGRQLAAWHVGYEDINHQNIVTVVYAPGAYIDYRVEKMRFASKDNKTQIIYNHQITLDNIPLKAYDYVVNGKSAIEWVMERYAPSRHKDSGIYNDPNDWQSAQPSYILELLQKVIWLSVETVKVVDSLPPLERFE